VKKELYHSWYTHLLSPPLYGEHIRVQICTIDSQEQIGLSDKVSCSPLSASCMQRTSVVWYLVLQVSSSVCGQELLHKKRGIICTSPLGIKQLERCMHLWHNPWSCLNWWVRLSCGFYITWTHTLCKLIAYPTQYWSFCHCAYSGVSNCQKDRKGWFSLYSPPALSSPLCPSFGGFVRLRNIRPFLPRLQTSRCSQHLLGTW